MLVTTCGNTNHLDLLLFFSTTTTIPGDTLVADNRSASAPLGSSLFWPFKAGFGIQFGDPSSSVGTYMELNENFADFNPTSGRPLYEVSPFNYGLYFDILRYSDGGNYTIGFVESEAQEIFSLTVTG